MAYLNRNTIPTPGILRAFQLTVIVEECALRSTAWVLDVTHAWRTQVTQELETIPRSIRRQSELARFRVAESCSNYCSIFAGGRNALGGHPSGHPLECDNRRC